MRLFAAALQGAQLAAGAALLGGDAASSAAGSITATMVRTVTAVATQTESATRATTGVLVEALGGPPARRRSSQGANRWVEVRGLDEDSGERVGEEVLTTLRATAGVETAGLNIANARAVVTVADGGPDATDLCRIIGEAESRAAVSVRRPIPVSLPGDDEFLAARLIGATVSSVGLGIAATAAALHAGRLSRAVLAPVVLAGNTPQMRRTIQRRLGADATELAFAILESAAGVLTASPAGLLAEAATRAMLAAEAINGRRTWRRLEPALSRQAIKSSGVCHDAPCSDVFAPDGFGERYADISAAVGLGAAAVLGAASRNTDIAATAALVAAAKPTRTIRESFACSLSRGLTAHHGALVMRPSALRRLDRIDTLVIDPRALHTDELAVTRIQGLSQARRAAAWDATRMALEAGAVTRGWQELSSIPDAGRIGEALISPVRDPFASAVVSEARRVGARVISLDDEGLRSLGQGFDELRPFRSGVDDALAAAVTELQADGATVALLTLGTGSGTRCADVTIGVWRDGSPPPWGAHVLLPDLTGVWRLLHALPAARRAAAKGVELSAGGSVIGALMLIPRVVGSGPASVSLAAAGALWSGHRIGAGVFDEHLPHPDPGHDWHALPVDEVRRLLPRPKPDTGRSGRLAALTAASPLVPVTTAIIRSWCGVREFVTALREDLADPITPILATGAAASALLGSPLDAVMVASVLLLNTAISAEQTLRAQRLLGQLLAAQDPLARRLVGEIGDGHHQDVQAGQLCPGDLIEVRSGDVIPADARVVVADAAEADESALTGESLPVAKSVDATPGAPLAERAGMLHAGTTLVAGRVIAVVATVGAGTQMNRASAMTARKARKVGLQSQLAHVTARVLPWSLAGGAGVGLLSLLRRTPLRESVASAVAIAVAAVPEGLPLVVTMAQLASARRLTDSAVLIRNPRAIEAFARLDVVCFDKTGTLSENRLQVTSVRPVPGVGSRRVLAAAVHTVRATTGRHFDHATDEAVRIAAADVDIAPGGTDVRLPFQSSRPFAAALIGLRLYVKGAPEAVTAALDSGPDPLVPLIDEMTASGLRVLAVAERELTPEQAVAAATDPVTMVELCGSQLTPLGVIGIADTPRPSARPLIEDLQARGIGVRLITGDHPATAEVAANQLGLTVTADQVMTGPVWEQLTTEKRTDAVRRYQVFARMAPEHKVQVVQALEAADLLTAMVGDGANDAAAIRAATVGIGVVSTGSDPARTAADVMLLDARIEALVDALDEGHQLWRRVQSAVSMLVGHNIGEVSFALITSLLTGRSALNARQILLINMLTDALPAAALAVSPQVGHGATDRDEAALWRAIWIRAAWATAGATLAWSFASVTGRPRRAATVALIGLVLTQMLQILVDSHSRLVVLTSVGTLAVMAIVISTPGISQMFGCTPVGPIGWGQAFAAAATAAGIWVLAPGPAESIARRLCFSVVDNEHARTHQQGVNLLDRWGKQSHSGRDQRVRADGTCYFSHVGKANRLTGVKGLPLLHARGKKSDAVDGREHEMLQSVRVFVASHRDVSKLVQEAERFSLRLPGVGKVGVPPPDQLAFYAVLALLAVIEVIDWPVAAAIGVGHVLTTQQNAGRVNLRESSQMVSETEEAAKAATLSGGEETNTC